MYDVDFSISFTDGLGSLLAFFELLTNDFSITEVRSLNVTSIKSETLGHVEKFEVTAEVRTENLQEVESLLDRFDCGKLEVSRTLLIDGTAVDEVLISHLDIGTRAYNCLRRGRIDTVAQLLERSEDDLALIPNFGRKSIREVVDFLESKGLQLNSQNTDPFWQR